MTIQAILFPHYLTRRTLLIFVIYSLSSHCTVHYALFIHCVLHPPLLAWMFVSLDTQLALLLCYLSDHSTASLATVFAHCDISTIYHRTHSPVPSLRIAQHRHSHPHALSHGITCIHSLLFIYTSGFQVLQPLGFVSYIYRLRRSGHHRTLASSFQPVLSLHTHHIP